MVGSCRAEAGRWRTAGRLAIALAGVLTAATRAAAAQGSDPLGALVAEAWRNNLGIQADRFAAQRADALAREARGHMLPSLALQTRYSKLGGIPDVGDLVNPAYAALNQLTGTNRFPTNISITFPQRHETRLTLTQPLFNEAIRAGDAAARAQRDGQHFALTASARQLAMDVQVAYLQLAAARRAADIYQASLALVQENERVAERLLAAGRSTPESVQRARAERADVEQQLLEAQENARAAERALNRILQRPLDTPMATLPDSVFERPIPVTEPGAVARALAAREELAQVDAGVRSAQAGRRAATASYLPSLSLAVDYGFQGRDLRFGAAEDYWSASLVFSWNLLNGGSDAARRAAAAADIGQARSRRADLESRIALDVRDAYEAAVTAHAAIATADARLEAARRTFELVRRRFEEGVASPIEFVDARTAYTSADLNRALTGYRYAIRLVVLERVAALRDLTSWQESAS